MTPRAYYNEHDKHAAAWLRNLITAGHIAPGDVDERDIRDVRPDDLRSYIQCHFFAGVGVWSHSLRRAGWPDRRPVWTASCPCQPFSAAGKGGGLDDERHLWPAFFHLVEQCGPRELFGEQVASKDGLAWLDLVQSDMEGAGYAFGALDICAAGFGAPHIRQRLYWTAHAPSAGWQQGGENSIRSYGGSGAEGRPAGSSMRGRTVELADVRHQGLQVRSIADDGQGTIREERPATPTHGVFSELANAECERRERRRTSEAGDRADAFKPTVGFCDAGKLGVADRAGPFTRREGRAALGLGCATDAASGAGELVDAGGARSGRDAGTVLGAQRESPGERGRAGRLTDELISAGSNAPTGPVNGIWRNADWLLCRDGKWRPVRSGSFPLAHGAASRVGRLRAYGNAIVAPQAEEFIGAYLDTEYLRLTGGIFA